jgi:hypothetical protein
MAKKKNSKINWSHYILELLVVFIGVTAGFLMNNWRVESSERDLEKKYLKSFVSDLKIEQMDLDTIIEKGVKKETLFIDILKTSLIVREPLNDSLAKLIVNEMIYISWFESTDGTYEDIKNSGSLSLVTDYKLKEEISSYYKFIHELKKVEQYYMDHIDNYGFPWLYKNYHVFYQEFADPERYKNLEFENMFLGTISFVQQNNQVYKKALEKNKELLQKIEEVLEQ